jgi:hypothetical protein
VEKIISGGQTGVDRAALDVSLEFGFPCGGWCPAGRKAEDGKIPLRYPLKALPTASYSERTLKNIVEADGTVIFYRKPLQGGTKLTAELCAKYHKARLSIDAEISTTCVVVDQIDEFVHKHSIKILNVAGPRASQWSNGYEFAYTVLYDLLRRHLDMA